MTRRTLHPWLQRLAALMLLGIGLGGLTAVMAQPLADAMTARDEARLRLDRLQALPSASSGDLVHYDPAELTAARSDDAAAQLALQADLDRLARAAGLVVQSVRPLNTEALGEVGRTVWVEANYTGDLQSITDFLLAMDRERPTLLVRRLDLQRGQGPRPDMFLPVRIEVGAAWRPGQPAAPAAAEQQP